MLKYLFTLFVCFSSFSNAEDGLVDPEFYKSHTVEIDGHLYNYSFIEHSPSCLCNNSD